MAYVIAVSVLLYSLTPTMAGARHHRPGGFCLPVYIEGAGTVRICAPARGR